MVKGLSWAGRIGGRGLEEATGWEYAWVDIGLRLTMRGEARAKAEPGNGLGWGGRRQGIVFVVAGAE